MRNLFIKKKTDKVGSKKSFKEIVVRDFAINKSLYLMLFPVLIYFIIFKYIPMYGAMIAFKDYSPALGVTGSPWVGFAHFRSFFESNNFVSLCVNTFRISFASLVFGFPVPIILALLMNEIKSKPFLKAVQNITYLPHFLSLVVVCGLIKDFTLSDGVIGHIVNFFGGESVSLLNDPKYFVPVYVASEIWQQAGWGTIIYLSALTSIDQSLYEAASVDGAGRLRQTWHITLPGILPTIVVMFILRMGSILNVGFEKIILLYNDSTMSVADVISTYVYRRGLINLDWGYSTAVGLFNSVVNLIFLVTANAINRKINNESLW